VLDFTNLRVTELFQVCTLNFSKDGGDLIAFSPLMYVCKVVVFFEDCGQPVFAVLEDRELWVTNVRYNNLKRVGADHKKFDDMILHKGKIYVVDRRGTIYWFNGSSFKLVQFLPNLNSAGKKKYLVESHESLFVLIYIEIFVISKFQGLMKNQINGFIQNVWVTIRFFLGKDSNFSLSTNDYHGFERNCIYFHIEKGTDCLRLKTLEIRHFDDIFWPCQDKRELIYT